jgi:rhodanese-related sulfurtransferase
MVSLSVEDRENTIGSRPMRYESGRAAARTVEVVRHHSRVHPDLPTVTVTDVPEGATILDVREDDEWEAGHVAGSVHVPLSGLPARAGEIPDGPLVVACKGGGRSAQVTAWLRGQGRDATNLAGGLMAWEAAGKPLVTDTGDPGDVL